MGERGGLGFKCSGFRVQDDDTNDGRSSTSSCWNSNGPRETVTAKWVCERDREVKMESLEDQEEPWMMERSRSGSVAVTGPGEDRRPTILEEVPAANDHGRDPEETQGSGPRRGRRREPPLPALGFWDLCARPQRRQMI